MTIVIAAGGTGGHLYPAVALAREFLRRDQTVHILFVGTSHGLESKVLAHEGFELAFIDARPVMGKNCLEMAKGLLAMPRTLVQCLRIIRSRRAALVIGVGGYTSPMMVLAAALMGATRVILEPNAYPGMANKLVGSLAQRVFLAFESAATSFDPAKVRVVGTPIRRAFIENVGQDSGTPSSAFPRLLVFGGSQGAKAINSLVIEGLSEMLQRCPQMQITHQTGERDHPRVLEAYHRLGVTATVAPFIYDMPSAIRDADLIVARSGAMTLAELTACGKPAVLIPLPTAIYDHQTKNARFMEAAGAAVVLPQAGLTGSTLARTVTEIIGEPPRLRAMGEASRALRRTDAAESIVRECYALIGEQHDHHQPVGETGR